MRSRSIATMLLAGLGVACSGRYIRPVTDQAIEPSPARLERGAYLVNQLCTCGACHTTRESGSLLDSESSAMFLGGGNIDDQTAPGRVRLYVPNLTGDATTGLGGWRDDEIVRAIRDGVDNKGGLLFPVMPFHAFQHMSDEDAASIVVYLRSVPKVVQPRPPVPREIPFMAKLFVMDFALAFHDPVRNVPTPPRSDRVHYGEYVAHLGSCTECHSLGSRGPFEADDSRYMSGSRAPFGYARLGKVWARNLTPDPQTGLGRYSAEQIKRAIQSGRRLDGKLMAPPMATLIPHISGMTDDDLDAVVSWLQSLKPVVHQIPERQLEPEMAAIYDAP
jgi:mono/diheme cytochrome c family protein